jgi:hypothetical protein
MKTTSTFLSTLSNRPSPSRKLFCVTLILHRRPVRERSQRSFDTTCRLETLRLIIAFSTTMPGLILQLEFCATRLCRKFLSFKKSPLRAVSGPHGLLRFSVNTPPLPRFEIQIREGSGDGRIPVLLKSLGGSSSITWLDLSTSVVDTETLHFINGILRSNETLTYLDLNHCYIGDEWP